jgi:hypothetical protein
MGIEQMNGGYVTPGAGRRRDEYDKTDKAPQNPIGQISIDLESSIPEQGQLLQSVMKYFDMALRTAQSTVYQESRLEIVKDGGNMYSFIHYPGKTDPQGREIPGLSRKNVMELGNLSRYAVRKAGELKGATVTLEQLIEGCPAIADFDSRK